MRIIAIGDVHGRTIWKDIVNKEKDADRIIFIGDYVDSFDLSGAQQLNNLKDILEFKGANMDKVVLLLGNHDYHYLPFCEYPFSGYQRNMALVFRNIYDDALNNNLIQICHIEGKYLFTHAGVTKTWCKEHDIDINDLENSLKERFKDRPRDFGFIDIGPEPDFIIANPYGDNIFQSPTWVRPISLMRDKLDNYIQVIGHTQVKEMAIIDDIIPIDVQDSTKQYLVIENGEPLWGKLEI